ncbi:hypothetical protein A2875_00940 [Candidatus Gottesmanbacteria bacterium RIFCSPHIGHO2_01_FULL_46_14]|uniref:Phospholipid/glycerol acyltransferase domain-containing protein n=1 Tax=Candidatus Gottesmanbacteria bacterium RIFCSPHIGHO2_01_FULL_46_14 TaxID=1798380 RepID=A0A1F5ZMZ7_9BACT|nr:MAG: hypothetical protein A2875_00940 [Candidatus Gottesmanbacteria bacterium RIFCSPHIGHO2_01_FULL_46_14]
MSEHKEPSPGLYLDALFRSYRQKRSFADAARDVYLAETSRVVVGRELIPHSGPFLAVANHFARFDNPLDKTGRFKMQDIFASMGAVAELVKKQVGEETPVVWTPSMVPRPEAVLPQNASARDVLDWMVGGKASLAAANLGREVFLQAFKHDPNMIPLPFEDRDKIPFFMALRHKLSQGAVVGIFPEGDVSYVLEPAQPGMAILAARARVPTVPFAIYRDGNTLNVHVADPIEPPTSIKQRDAFTHHIMKTIANMLPQNLRGYYDEKGHA